LLILTPGLHWEPTREERAGNLEVRRGHSAKACNLFNLESHQLLWEGMEMETALCWISTLCQALVGHIHSHYLISSSCWFWKVGYYYIHLEEKETVAPESKATFSACDWP
jgi:hypothetical protein